MFPFIFESPSVKKPAHESSSIRRHALTQLVMLLLCVILRPDVSSAESASQPNVLFILIDDMGWSDLSCFGNQEAETPNLDKLAQEGIRFGQFYVNAPICSPSRTAFLTGQYPQRWGIHSFLNNRAENERRGMKNWLDVSAPSLGRVAKNAGYMTGHFDKWHMGGQRDVDEAPLISEYGFDESLINFEGLGPRLLGIGNAHDGTPPNAILSTPKRLDVDRSCGQIAPNSPKAMHRRPST